MKEKTGEKPRLLFQVRDCGSVKIRPPTVFLSIEIAEIAHHRQYHRLGLWFFIDTVAIIKNES